MRTLSNNIKVLISIILVFNTTGFLCETSFGQSKSPVAFDEVKFLESEYNRQMTYIKWYSKGRNPAPLFLSLRYENEKPVQVKGIQMIYQKHDTTFYVMQDTLAPVLKDQEMLQYFMTPHDTAGKAGTSSAIVLVSKGGSRWFTKTAANKLEKEKGIKVGWRFSNTSVVKFFEIYRSIDFTKDYKLVTALSPNDTVYHDYGIQPDRVYYYRIHAVPVDGNQAVESNVIFSAGFNPQPPLPPYIKSARGVKNGAVLYIQVTDAEAGGVRVYRDDGKVPELKLVSDLLRVPDSLVVVFYDTASYLSGRKTYTYAAKTESTSFIESSLSNKVYVRPIIAHAPDAPAELSAYEEDGVVQLFWDNMEVRDLGIAGYRVSRKEESPVKGKVTQFIDFTPVNTFWKLNHYTDTTASPGRTYTYQVTAVDIDGNISKTGTLATVSLQANYPIAPFAVTGYRTDEGINLTWSQTLYTDITAVNLYRYQRGSKAVLVAKLPADATEYLDKDTKAGSLYFYYLTTTNKAGIESKPSEEAGIR